MRRSALQRLVEFSPSYGTQHTPYHTTIDAVARLVARLLAGGQRRCGDGPPTASRWSVSGLRSCVPRGVRTVGRVNPRAVTRRIGLRTIDRANTAKYQDRQTMASPNADMTLTGLASHTIPHPHMIAPHCLQICRELGLRQGSRRSLVQGSASSEYAGAYWAYRP